MTDRLVPRGPDGKGVHHEAGVALGHRRLSIIDLSERGRQPMSNEDGTVWLTFNGEIYNYRELRRQLTSRGHRFSSDSDSEVLIHLYEDWAENGGDFLGSVRGMFAFAIWDQRRQRLLLARDRLGIKPLLYHLGDNFLAFASDIDSLTACPHVPRRLDWTSVYEYLILLTVPGPHTIFRDIKYLPPGRILLIEQGKASEIVYWGLSPQTSELISDADEAAEAVESALSEAVRLHMVADVEVGAFLSGGIDSGVVTALASQKAMQPLRTFSATFPGESVNEGPWAKEASERLGTTHTELAVTGGFLESIEPAVEAMDQPLALTSAISLFHLSRLAREQIKVVLTGDGGDEIFAGYNRHRPYPVPARAVGWVPPGLRPLVGSLGRASVPAWARRRSPSLRKVYALSEALSRDESELYAPRVYYLRPAEALSLLPQDAIPEVDTTRYLERLRGVFSNCPFTEPLSRMLFTDLQTSLVDEMLSKVDRMTMASGLEARVPLLDHVVVETGMRVTDSAKRTGALGKLPLRRIAERHLGREVGERAKHGFNSPLDGWLKNDRTTRAGLESLWPSVERSGVFDSRELGQFKAGFEVGSVSGLNLFALLVFGVWAEQRQVRAA